MSSPSLTSHIKTILLLTPKLTLRSPANPDGKHTHALDDGMHDDEIVEKVLFYCYRSLPSDDNNFNGDGGGGFKTVIPNLLINDNNDGEEERKDDIERLMKLLALAEGLMVFSSAFSNPPDDTDTDDDALDDDEEEAEELECMTTDNGDTFHFMNLPINSNSNDDLIKCIVITGPTITTTTNKSKYTQIDTLSLQTLIRNLWMNKVIHVPPSSYSHSSKQHLGVGALLNEFVVSGRSGEIVECRKKLRKFKEEVGGLDSFLTEHEHSDKDDGDVDEDTIKRHDIINTTLLPEAFTKLRTLLNSSPIPLIRKTINTVFSAFLESGEKMKSSYSGHALSRILSKFIGQGLLVESNNFMPSLLDVNTIFTVDCVTRDVRSYFEDSDDDSKSKSISDLLSMAWMIDGHVVSTINTSTMNFDTGELRYPDLINSVLSFVYSDICEKCSMFTTDAATSSKGKSKSVIEKARDFVSGSSGSSGSKSGSSTNDADIETSTGFCMLPSSGSGSGEEVCITKVFHAQGSDSDSGSDSYEWCRVLCFKCTSNLSVLLFVDEKMFIDPTSLSPTFTLNKSRIESVTSNLSNIILNSLTKTSISKNTPSLSRSFKLPPNTRLITVNQADSTYAIGGSSQSYWGSTKSDYKYKHIDVISDEIDGTCGLISCLDDVCHQLRLHSTDGMNVNESNELNEVCTSVGKKGWVFGRRRGEREVYVILEGFWTIGEVMEGVEMIFGGVLSGFLV